MAVPFNKISISKKKKKKKKKNFFIYGGGGGGGGGGVLKSEKPLYVVGVMGCLKNCRDESLWYTVDHSHRSHQ